MTTDLIEAEDVVEFTGVVIPPPSLDSVLFLIEVGAESKAGVNLSASDARVLHNYLKEVGRGPRV